mgnify:CR=1 FL=1
MANYGVIDLGSNSIRLVIFDVKAGLRGKKPLTSRNFRSIINDKVMAGLSAYVEGASFTQEGIERAASVLSGHLKRARYFDCVRTDIFATAVLRNCENSQQAISAIEKATGAKINLLSARDEAHLSFIGASCDREMEQGTLVDLGGGSCELVRIENGRDFDDASVGQGSLSSYAGFVKFVVPQAGEIEAIERAFLDRARETVGSLESYRAQRLYGVGGSARAVAKLYAELVGESVRPKALAPAHFDLLIDSLERDPSTFAHAAARAVPERIHTVMPGCVILRALMRELSADALEVCKRGVREGYLIERMLA